MAFEELIAWSDQNVRPNWQKDALRRLATTGELSKEDLSDLSAISSRRALFPPRNARILPPETGADCATPFVGRQSPTFPNTAFL